MLWILGVAVFLPLVTITKGLDSGMMLRLDSCGLVNLITDTLVGLDLAHAAANDDLMKKMVSKKGGGSAMKGVNNMKIDSFSFTEISLTFLPGSGMEMHVSTKSAVSGKSFLGGKIEMKMEVKIISTTLVNKEPEACPKLTAGSCITELLSVKTNLPKGMLPSVMNNFVDKTLKKMLPKMLCPPVDKVLRIVNELLCKEDAIYPLGTTGIVQYTIPNLPTVENNYLEIDFNVMFNMEPMDISSDSVASSSAHENLPFKQHATSLTFTADFMLGIFTALKQEGTFNFNLSISQDELQSSYSGVIPGLPDMTQFLEVMVTVEKPVQFTTKADKPLLHLLTTTEVLASTEEGHLQSLFVLNVHLNVQTEFTVAEQTLHTSLTVDRITTDLASTSVGSFEVKGLETFVEAVMNAYTSANNAQLEVGVPLPPLMSMNFVSAQAEIHKGLIYFSINACKDKRALE